MCFLPFNDLCDVLTKPILNVCTNKLLYCNNVCLTEKRNGTRGTKYNSGSSFKYIKLNVDFVPKVLLVVSYQGLGVRVSSAAELLCWVVGVLSAAYLVGCLRKTCHCNCQPPIEYNIQTGKYPPDL